MYADKLSMAHGLEARVPYLDKEVVEYVERIAASLKVRNGTRKWLHREVCKKFLPRAILRRKKRGFAVNVVDDWFRGSLGNDIDRMLLDRESVIYNYLRPSAVEQMMKQHKSGQHDNHKVLFSLVILEQWLRINRPIATGVYGN
jgi:asparagine synthase (glutamine-hydrolysing)